MNYLVENTTKEERAELANKALAISLTGAEKPSKEVLELVNQYVEGNIELEQIQKYIINKYKHKGDTINE